MLRGKHLQVFSTTALTLQSNIVLQIRLHFSKFRFVVVAPGQAFRDVLLCQRVLHLLRDEKQVDVCQVLYVGLLGQTECGIVITGAQKMFYEHSIDSRLAPLALGHRTCRNTTSLQLKSKHIVLTMFMICF